MTSIEREETHIYRGLNLRMRSDDGSRTELADLLKPIELWGRELKWAIAELWAVLQEGDAISLEAEVEGSTVGLPRTWD
jgi:hypothetical protein